MTAPTLEGTNALMRHKLTAVILATGGTDLVRAVYTAGKPAYGVGPGNVPAIIERTARIDKAVADIVDGKTFDAGVLCSAENSVVCDAPVERAVRDAFRREGAHFCTAAEKKALEQAMIPPGGKGIVAEVVGQQPQEIARRAGFSVSPGTKLLIVDLHAVGRDDPLSREKLSPVLGFFVEDGWEACCQRAIQLLRLGGLGHSLGIHSQDDHVIEQFFLEKPAFRIVVNSNVALGAVGYTTGFAPAMTLGPGAWGGSITSDNVTPMHLLNIKRLGAEVRPYLDPLRARTVRDGHGASTPAGQAPRPRTQRAPTPDAAVLSAEEVRKVVDEFLRGFRHEAAH
jgi:acetaldehyde dehydrogenase (acetylating)